VLKFKKNKKLEIIDKYLLNKKEILLKDKNIFCSQNNNYNQNNKKIMTKIKVMIF
jgi:hypothetical protein